MCEVVTTRSSPCHSPVENPIHVWGMYSAGCGPAVHPDRAPLLVGAQVHLGRHDFLRIGIALVPYAKLQRPTEDMRDVVDLALMLGHRAARDVPAVGEEARGLVDRKARVVAETAARHTVHLIFLVPARPLPFEADLRRGGTADQQYLPGHTPAGRAPFSSISPPEILRATLWINRRPVSCWARARPWQGTPGWLQRSSSARPA